MLMWHSRLSREIHQLTMLVPLTSSGDLTRYKGLDSTVPIAGQAAASGEPRGNDDIRVRRLVTLPNYRTCTLAGRSTASNQFSFNHLTLSGGLGLCSQAEVSLTVCVGWAVFLPHRKTEKSRFSACVRWGRLACGAAVASCSMGSTMGAARQGCTPCLSEPGCHAQTLVDR